MTFRKSYLAIGETSSPALNRKDFFAEPPRDFEKYFRLSNSVQIALLWKSFQDWHKKHPKGDYASFANFLRDCRQDAINILKSWPCILPNAKKGEFYRADFDFPDSIHIIGIQSCSEAGLVIAKYSHTRHRITIIGKPLRAKDLQIKFKYIWTNYAPYFQPLEGTLQLAINPDPNELWKNIPSDPASEYYKPDCDALTLTGEKCRIFAASVRGRSHAHKGLWRDDDFRIVEKNGWYFLAVADGAGSAPYARKGSQLACWQAGCTLRNSDFRELDDIFASSRSIAEIREKLPQIKKLAYHILPGAAFEAYKAIKGEAFAKNRKPRDYATTLLLAILKFFPLGCVLISFQIGDGCMAVIDEDMDNFTATLLAEPDEGDFGGQTRFVTMEEMFAASNLMERLKFHVFPDFSSLIMMTDGISDAKFATLVNLQNPACWYKLWAQLKPCLASGQPLPELVSWLGFWSPGNHDDRTIVVLEKI